MDALRYNFVIILGILLAIFFIACSAEPKSIISKDTITESDKEKDYQRILDRGRIVVLMENKPSSYFVYRGAKMGYEYELISEFAKKMNLKIEVKIINNRDNILYMLRKRKGDIIACNYAVMRSRTREINYSKPYIKAKQVLVQRLLNNSEQIAIKSPTELKRQRIYVWRNSSYYNRLLHLQEEIGDTIYIEPLDGTVSVEELIERVAQGEIDYTIAEENIARIASKFHPNIDFSVAISIQQDIAFGLRKESTLLKEKLDAWMDSFLTTSKHKYIFRKYYKQGVSGMQPDNTYSSLGGKQISPYDIFFQDAAKQYGIDWQLIASIAYQESKFNPQAKGFGGAYGIMQFMPSTGKHYGVFADSNPKEQIQGGTRKIKSDIDSWKHIPDKEQQIKFAIASYNAGRGHVEDAQRLAEKHKLNPKKWDENVEKMMILLSQQKYYNDKLVKHGFIRGSITSNYVREVFARYQEWKILFVK